jgi:Glycosyl hydrolase family 9
VIVGAMVGGPNVEDNFLDVRGEYHYTEVALDYNAGLLSALGALAAAPPTFWDSNCTQFLPKYPWT